MHIYGFGSVCRGEISKESDVDLIAIVNGFDDRFDPSTYSVYSYEKIGKIWRDGSPFAWHLSTEAKILFSDDGRDLFRDLGEPSSYVNARNDCSKFRDIFQGARESIRTKSRSVVLDLSTIFLAVRNIATFYSLYSTDIKPQFSRDSALKIGSKSLDISDHAYAVLKRARLLSTRGFGKHLIVDDIEIAVSELNKIDLWIQEIMREVE